MQPAGGPNYPRHGRGASLAATPLPCGRVARHRSAARRWMVAPAPLSVVVAVLLLLLLAVGLSPRGVSAASPSIDACSVTAADLAALRGGVRSSFWHAYGAYTTHGLPADDLLPLSCAGTNASFGGMALTLIDAMDTLAVLGEWRAFVSAARYVQTHVSWAAVNATVSVFEVNIRALGGLLAAHQLLTEAAADAGWVPAEWYPDYDGGLLRLAAGLGDRLVVAFDTRTGVPIGSLSPVRGVAPGETTEASVAGGGTYVLEMGTLSRLTGDGRYGRAAVRSALAIFGMRAWTGLVRAGWGLGRSLRSGLEGLVEGEGREGERSGDVLAAGMLGGSCLHRWTCVTLLRFARRHTDVCVCCRECAFLVLCLRVCFLFPWVPPRGRPRVHPPRFSSPTAASPLSVGLFPRWATTWTPTLATGRRLHLALVPSLTPTSSTS